MGDVELKHEKMSEAEVVCYDLLTIIVKAAHMQLITNICRALANNPPCDRLCLLVLAYRAECILRYEDDDQLSLDEDERAKINNIRNEVLQAIDRLLKAEEYIEDFGGLYERASTIEIVMTAILDTPIDKRTSLRF